MNVIFVAGKVGMDAELRTLPSGKCVLNWKMVCDVGWGEKKHPLWIECALFGVRAEKLAPHITKGKPMSIYGTFDLRSYNTKNGPGASITCDVQDIQLQGSAAQSQERQAEPAFDDKKAADVAFDDDVPFSFAYWIPAGLLGLMVLGASVGQMVA